MYLYLSEPLIQLIFVSSPLFLIISSHSFDTLNSGEVLTTSASFRILIICSSGIEVGISCVILPRTTGTSDSKLSAMHSAIFVFACPICPTKRISCPARIALFTAGITSSLYPIIPG